MAKTNRFINIKFPFQQSEEGYLFGMNRTSKDAVRSDLSHLLFARKNQRLYNPEFGLDLFGNLFEPMDDINYNNIKSKLNETVKNFIPGIVIENIEVIPNEELNSVNVKVEYTYTEGIFKNRDIIEVVV